MVWTFGRFRLDPGRFELTSGGRRVPLEPQVLSLLIYLVRNSDRMVTKDEIAAVVWNGGIASDASIATRIRAARKAVGDDGEGQTVIRTVHGRGFRFVADVRLATPNLELSESGSITGSFELTRPSIAVLPLQPLAVPPEVEVLADALPHEIIQALSRLRWLAVIARGSSFRFRKYDIDLAGTALGARYVLTGVLEARGKNISIIFELTDVGRSEVIWGDRLASPIDEIDELRNQIVNRVIAAIDLQIPENEARCAVSLGTERLDAWANYHLGLHHLYHFTSASNAEARHYFAQAVSLDPCLARAHAGLSFTSFLEAFLQLGPRSEQAAQAARRHAERSLELDSLDPFSHFNMGRSFWLTGEPDAAQEWLDRAVDLNPNYAQGFYARAFTGMLLGNSGSVNPRLAMALQLSPLDPLLYGIYGVRSLMLIQTGDYDEAARWGDRAAITPGAHFLIAMVAAVANGLSGRQTKALRWCEEVRRRKPDASVEQFRAAFPISDGTAKARMCGELKRLGFD